MSVFVVEDIKAATRGKKRWDRPFSPLEVGKAWFYGELSKLAPVQTKQGYETKELREQLGLKKTGKKTAEVWEAHCVAAWTLAYAAVGGRRVPDSTRLVCLAPLVWHRRQLHRLEPEKGGRRKPYGDTLSLGIKRGHPGQAPAVRKSLCRRHDGREAEPARPANGQATHPKRAGDSVHTD